MITPGKWIARIDENCIDVIEEKSGFGVVWMGYKTELDAAQYPYQDASDNAKLIAAAPEMFSVLQDLMNEYEKKGQLLGFDVNKARKVLKRATE